MQHLQMASRPDRQPGPVVAMMVDLVCLPEGGMVEVPAHLVDERATLPCAALTAWSVVVSCDVKLERAKALGADAGINYRTTPNGRSRRAHR